VWSREGAEEELPQVGGQEVGGLEGGEVAAAVELRPAHHVVYRAWILIRGPIEAVARRSSPAAGRLEAVAPEASGRQS
jgi:hypothetical protein